MAVYKIFPTKDATLYSQFPETNTGMDQILEATSYYYLGTRQNNRYLIQFSTTEIQNVLNDKVSGADFKSSIKNYLAQSSGLTTSTQLKIYTTSGSWNMGTGRLGYEPATVDGVSWNFRFNSGSEAWTTSGGDWYNSPVYSQSFNYSDPKDINVDITDTVLTWYSESVPNDGLLLKLSSSIEESTSTSIQPRLKYFSIDTNTIYPPQLEFKWYDYSFDTGSSTNTVLGTPEAFISIYNNSGVYYSESVARMRLAAIPKYPDRQFITASYYTQNYYLPESQSLYAIKDSETNEFVVEFDSTYTRISSDTSSSYFDVYMNGLEPERYYTVLIKTIIDGTTKVWDEDIMFKVTKG